MELHLQLNLCQVLGAMIKLGKSECLSNTISLIRDDPCTCSNIYVHSPHVHKPINFETSRISRATDVKNLSLKYFVFFLQDQTSEGAKAFLASAAAVDDHPFGITSDDSVFSEYKVEGEKVVLFKKVINIFCVLNTIDQTLDIFSLKQMKLRLKQRG